MKRITLAVSILLIFSTAAAAAEKAISPATLNREPYVSEK